MACGSSCSNGGSGGGGGQNGTLNMSVSDASTEDWAAIDAKILSVALVPPKGTRNLFSRSLRIGYLAEFTPAPAGGHGRTAKTGHQAYANTTAPVKISVPPTQ
jgi:hypothetical protein